MKRSSDRDAVFANLVRGGMDAGRAAEIADHGQKTLVYAMALANERTRDLGEAIVEVMADMARKMNKLMGR